MSSLALCIYFADDLTTTHSSHAVHNSSFGWFWLMLFLFIAFKRDTKNKIPKWYVMYASSGNNKSEHASERKEANE